MKRIFNFFNRMITDAGGGTNSKIFVGLVSFFISLIGYFWNIVTFEKFCVMLGFCSTALGWSYLDNKSAIQIKSNISKTTTETKDTKVEIEGNVENIIEEVKKKKNG